MNNLDHFIRDVKDFPKAGILFKDIVPLLQNPKAVKQCLDALMGVIGAQKIDKVVGIGSRGFFFGTLLAQKLNPGFIPIRKPGKLPHTIISETYSDRIRHRYFRNA